MSFMKILVVDDNQQVGDLVGKVLGSIGCEVRVCYNFADAYQYLLDLKQNNCNAVLSDVMLDSGHTGYELYQAACLISHESVARFAFMTGGIYNPILEQKIKDSGVEVLQKPIGIGTLRELVANFIAR